MLHADQPKRRTGDEVYLIIKPFGYIQTENFSYFTFTLNSWLNNRSIVYLTLLL